jgi:hypothetical protein
VSSPLLETVRETGVYYTTVFLPRPRNDDEEGCLVPGACEAVNSGRV